MSKITLNVNEKELFGNYLPSVNIDRVILDYLQPDPDDDWTYGRWTSVTMHYSVYLTYPPDLEESQACNWVTDNLGNVRIFAVFCPNPAMNKQVRNGRLLLQDLFKLINARAQRT